MIYTVKKTVESEMTKIQWEKANTLELKNYMGSKPQHFPKTEAKLLYDKKNIYVFFKVEDQYIKAVAQKLHDPVCKDSCVEFFFTPSENLSDGYFNIEINCGGTMLMCHQTARSENKIIVSEQNCKKIILHTYMPKIIEPELNEPKTWTLQYMLPIEILKEYAKVSKPAKGTKWRANFYKCADATSHPHWLTWALVDLPEPDFHQPKFFGELLFE